ncbi:MAG: ribosome-binding factor A [Oligosphaeraceae bacterium]
MPVDDRIARLNCQILRELGLLGEVIIRPHIPDALVTFVAVELASNLRTATVFFSVYGGDSAKRRAMELMKRKRVALQEGIARKVPMKYTPVLHFRLDETAERADRVLTILNQLNLPQEEDAKHPREENHQPG